MDFINRDHCLQRILIFITYKFFENIVKFKDFLYSDCEFFVE